jgi:hypothetical protein
MIPRFGLWTFAALMLFVLLGIFHHDTAAPDPAATLVAKLRAQGHTISKPKTALWDTPGFAFLTDDCPAPVDVVLFDFDEILSPGILPAVQAIKRGTMQVRYDGDSFNGFDRSTLYRLRFRKVAAGLIHGKLVDPPVILLFWPAGCVPKAVL